MAVNEPLRAYREMERDWRVCEALMGGTRAMRGAGRLFLPQFSAEGDTEYEARLNRTVLLNMFKRAVDALAGKVFSRPPVLGSDVPEAVREWAEDVDMCGRHLNVFARDLFRDAVVYGASHFLVDHPPAGDGGGRPYWAHVPARSLIGWRSAMRGGREVLIQARILERSALPEGEFGERSRERVRVLEPGSYRVFERDEGRWVLAESGETSLDFIPLVSLYAHRTGFMTARPPLMDLADKNVEHWQSASDQRNVLTVARFPILAVTGFGGGEAEMPVGPQTLIRLPSETARVYYAEHSGAAIEAGRRDLEDLKEEMGLMSIEPLMRRTGDPTATARALDSAQADSSLKGWVLALEDALELGLAHTAAWSGLECGGSVSVNRDFGLSLTASEDARLLLDAHMAGALTRRQLLDEYHRRGLLEE